MSRVCRLGLELRATTLRSPRTLWSIWDLGIVILLEDLGIYVRLGYLDQIQFEGCVFGVWQKGLCCRHNLCTKAVLRSYLMP